MQRIAPLLLAAIMTTCAALTQAQDNVVIERRSADRGSDVSMVNIYTKQAFLPFVGNSFAVPPGYYSVRLSRDSKVYYSEPELVNSKTEAERVVEPKGDNEAVGLNLKNFSFNNNDRCSAIVFSALTSISRLGISRAAISERFGPYSLGLRDLTENLCPDNQIGGGRKPSTGALTGSYGDIGFGNAILHIEPLAASDEIDAILSRDVQNGFMDVAVIGSDVYLICGLNRSTGPRFCDKDGIEDGGSFAIKSRTLMKYVNGAQYWRVYIDVVQIDTNGVEQGHWVDTTDQESVKTFERKLSYDAKAISRTLDNGIKSLRPIRVTSGHAMGFLEEDESAYSTGELLALKLAVQTQTRKALSGQDLHPLKRHFDNSFDKIDLQRSPTTPAASASLFLDALQSIVGRLTSVSDDLSVDLIFLTQPADTEGSSLTLKDCERCARIFSQGGSHRFFRGKYDYVVSKKGYKDFKDTFDLVDDPGTKLVCKLVKETREDADSECSMQSTQ